MTYCFLMQCNIPERVGVIKPREWKRNIHDMLKLIPSISSVDLDAFLDSIDAKLFNYLLLLQDVAPLLELAIWKDTIMTQFDQAGNILNNEMRMQSRYSPDETDIILNILSFF